MPVSVFDVLKLPLVDTSLPQVLAGAHRLDNEVRWVHVSELNTIASLLRGGELVLTTGMALNADDIQGVEYLQSLKDAGACGLVVELGATLEKVPAAVAAKAQRLEFPLIALRREIRFVELTQIVHEMLVGEQYTHIKFARDVHEAFTSLSLDNATAEVITRRTAEMCDASVVLEDLSHTVLAYGTTSDSPASLLFDWEQRSRLSVDRRANTGTGERWLTTPVGMTGNHWGRLVMPHPPQDALPVKMVLERAAQALELGRMVERDRVSLRFQAQGGLLGELSNGAVEEIEAVTRAAALGFKPSRVYLPIIIRTGSGRGEAAFAIHRRTKHLAERAAQAAEAAGISTLTGLWGEREVAVIAACPSGDRETESLDRFCVAFERGPHGSFSGRRSELVGVGRSAHQLTVAAASLREAGHAAEVASATTQRSPRLYYRIGELRVRGLLTLLAKDSRVQTFVESELQRLLAHDAQTGDRLVDFLRMFLNAGGNKSELSRVSRLSRPALYSRLEKIQRILDVDLSDPESRLSLHIALVAYEQRSAAEG
ncbi:PucR family transcriptional regulator [Rhodococcus sp. NPDC057529]|uniref:PucR family transcriptional regulator n=1 Tax=Rhodococcus sp. NPDC057529 TaxID=3346158 RepID=UPI00366B7F7F